MDKKILELAKRNVELFNKEDLKEQIKEEYKQLLYKSEKKKTDKNTLIKIQRLFEKSKSINPLNFGDAYPCFYAKKTIKEYVETGKYHPKTFVKLKNWINSRVN